MLRLGGLDDLGVASLQSAEQKKKNNLQPKDKILASTYHSTHAQACARTHTHSLLDTWDGKLKV